jgi:hypothetical protein
MTNWGSRMGFARLAEQSIRKSRGKAEGEKLGALDRVAASSIGGALGCWNQPIEVSSLRASPRNRAEPLAGHPSRGARRGLCPGLVLTAPQMQSMAKGAHSANRPAKLTVAKCVLFR